MLNEKEKKIMIIPRGRKTKSANSYIKGYIDTNRNNRRENTASRNMVDQREDATVNCKMFTNAAQRGIDNQCHTKNKEMYKEW